MKRVTDDMVRHWLDWARNFGEVVAYRVGSGSARRFRVRVPPGITNDGSPFRLRQGLFDITGHDENDVVPAELMLTAREALVFGMGCAVGRTAALMEAEKDWQRARQEEWSPELRTEFARLRQEARDANRAELDQEAAEHEEERQRRIAEYRRRKEAETNALPRA